MLRRIAAAQDASNKHILPPYTCKRDGVRVMTGVGEDQDWAPTLQDPCTRHTSRQTDDR